MTKVNIVVGRFQPFTIGHLKCCTNIFKQRGLRTVLCIIDTVKPDERHPFLTKIMWPAFKALVKEYDEIEDVILVKNADIVKIGEALGAKGYSVATWACGTDRFVKYNSWVHKYAPDVDLIEIHREDSDVSGTQVRELISQGKKEQFEELTPKPMHKLFDKFKDALDALK
jgi:nicotinamide mononucleotide adenylyltransferase